MTRRVLQTGLGLSLPLLITALWLARGATPEIPSPDWIPYPDRPLAITATEVTVAQFGACVDAGACDVESTRACNSAQADRADHPVNCVDYYGAEQYCRWAGGRICTEPEWLMACRGTGDHAFPYGDHFDPAACNAAPSDGPESAGDTAPVGSYADCAGGLGGLYDMAGNVWEWVDACKDDYCKFRGGAFATNPPVERFAACGEPCSGNRKVLRSATVGIRCCRDPLE